MRLGVRPATAELPRNAALWVGVTAGDKLESLKLPRAASAPVQAAINARDVTGRLNQSAVVYLDQGRILLSGLGPRKDISLDGLRIAAARAARRAQKLE